MFFGKKIGFPRRLTEVARRYHATTSPGPSCRAHVNRWWTLVLEVAVLAHGTLVAIMQGEGMWPMFAFGFGGIFVITQMHGLSWPRRVRGLVLAAYCAGVLAVYGPLGWSRLSEVLRIPLIDYAAVFALAGIIGGVIGVLRLLGRSAPGRRTPASRLSCHDRCRAPPALATGPTKCAGTAVRSAVSVCRQAARYPAPRLEEPRDGPRLLRLRLVGGISGGRSPETSAICGPA